MAKRIGTGSYGEAYIGYDVPNNQTVVVKIYNHKMSYSKMMNEILILQAICGAPNVVKLYDVVLETIDNSKNPALIFERINNVDFKELYPTFTLSDVKHYCREMLIALYHIKKNEILHRDIKPSNIMIDPDQNMVRIIDFGLSRFQYDGVNHTIAGTRYFKAPEILMEYRAYSYPVDMWAFGCLFAGMIFKRHYFFQGGDDHEQLTVIAKVFGSEKLVELAKKLQVQVDLNSSEYTVKETTDWKSFITDDNKELATDTAIDLLSKILV